MTTQTLHPDWTESPLVRHAIERAGTAAEAVDVLGVLDNMLHHLEDLAPGVPFTELVEAWNPESSKRGRDALAAGLAARGMTEGQIVDLLGRDDRTHYETHPHYEEILADRFAGHTLRTVATTYGVSRAFVERLVQDYLARQGTPHVMQAKDVELDPEFNLAKALVLANPTVTNPEKMAKLAKAEGMKMGHRRLKRVMELLR